MKTIFKSILLTIATLMAAVPSFAQSGYRITGIFKDASNGDPISFATVSLTPAGAKKPSKYILTNDEGKCTLEGVRKGTYSLTAELLGYEPFTKELKVEGNIDLGEVKMKVDKQQLDAATVSAVGNPIMIKKDTIEYNASSFKTTDNDVLEDLLKKLPGVEVDDDGAITVNGETITKITIDGKTFFLDDPQLASKNIPAKVINKLKVIEKKSDQAEFTGIDDGEEEHVIDLSIKKGMMKGVFGNVMAGAGHDIPASKTLVNDTRFQGAGFMGKFTDKSQISIVLNANNTNNRGFNDLSGNMMGNMRGGGGGGGRGITTSYMGGLNGAWDLFDNKMKLGGNYLYNNTDRDVEQQSMRKEYITGRDYDQLTNSSSVSSNKSQGHRFGIRLEHKFSDNTSIIFQPQVNFGTGNYVDVSADSIYRNNYDLANRLSRSEQINAGSNRNMNTYGFLLFRQRLGIPGRTMTVTLNYNLSRNELRGFNHSLTSSYDTGKQVDSLINQVYDSKSNRTSITGRINYTEPIGGSFYVEANYSYSWSRSESEKLTYDAKGVGRDTYKDFSVSGLTPNVMYSNSIINEYVNQNIGANFLYQKGKSRAQIGVALKPTKTHNETTKKGVKMPYDSYVLNWAPQAMAFYEFNENSNLRFFYNGRSNQPSNNQLMPVPDNTNPMRVSFGNPSLEPYFSHGIRADFRYNNKKTFFSFNIRANANITQNPIVNATWHGTNGASYSMPFNGKNSASAGLSSFVNIPINKSKYTIANMLNANWSKSYSYNGEKIDMTKYYDKGDLDYDSFLTDFNDGKVVFGDNSQQSLSIMERLRFSYREDNLEIRASISTRMSNTWTKTLDVMNTRRSWNNQAAASVNWTWEATGITIKSDFNYRWYNGNYEITQTPQAMLNAEIQKLLFNKKVTLAVKGYDILGQGKTLSVSDSANVHMETVGNTLGRYIIASLTYRFGTFDRSKMGGRPGGPGMGGPRR